MPLEHIVVEGVLTSEHELDVLLLILVVLE